MRRCVGLFQRAEEFGITRGRARRADYAQAVQREPPGGRPHGQGRRVPVPQEQDHPRSRARARSRRPAPSRCRARTAASRRSRRAAVILATGSEPKSLPGVPSTRSGSSPPNGAVRLERLPPLPRGHRGRGGRHGVRRRLRRVRRPGHGRSRRCPRRPARSRTRRSRSSARAALRAAGHRPCARASRSRRCTPAGAGVDGGARGGGQGRVAGGRPGPDGRGPRREHAGPRARGARGGHGAGVRHGLAHAWRRR